MTDNIVDIDQCHSFYFTSYNAHTKLEKEKETENEKIKKNLGIVQSELNLGKIKNKESQYIIIYLY